MVDEIKVWRWEILLAYLRENVNQNGSHKGKEGGQSDFM